MKRTLAILLALFLLPSIALAYGHKNHNGTNGQGSHQHHSHGGNVGGSSGSSGNGGQPTPIPPTPSPTPSPVPPPNVGGSVALNSVYLTFYSEKDNTPAGSSETDLGGHTGVLGGDCTYNNPTTIAVGHVITNGNDAGDFAYGTKFYIPKLQCYFSAQDTCGDGSTPQNGPCHKPEQGSLQLDAYVGPNGTATCESNMTNIYSVVENPLPGLPVQQGFICK